MCHGWMCVSGKREISFILEILKRFFSSSMNAAFAIKKISGMCEVLGAMLESRDEATSSTGFSFVLEQCHSQEKCMHVTKLSRK